ncbi:hypothetical protein TNCV_4638811 [Trichonephila clavipes]|uniref:Uncharacterized protein n=1 Tax=Trichonephila clavipes TaxID=2585209 RepID=A0A8X7BIS0_TRICX|nr:hypothetical protein TNCV_4638811 [Trichonephila clavipes]
MNETPATNTERAGRRSDPVTSWRRSGMNEGSTRKESISKRDHGGGEVTVRTDPVSICSRAFGVVDDGHFHHFDFVSKGLVATPSLHLPMTNQVIPSPSRTATPSDTINNYDIGWRLVLQAICPATKGDILHLWYT